MEQKYFTGVIRMVMESIVSIFIKIRRGGCYDLGDLIWNDPFT